MQIPLPSCETLLMLDAKGSLFFPLILTPLLGCSSAVQCIMLVCRWIQQCCGTAHCRTLAAYFLPWPGFGFPHAAALLWELLLNCTPKVHSTDPSPQPHSLGTRTEERWIFSSHLILERLRVIAPKGNTRRHKAGASTAHLMWSCKRKLKNCWGKGSNKEFGLAASAQRCWRDLGADYGCSC